MNENGENNIIEKIEKKIGTTFGKNNIIEKKLSTTISDKYKMKLDFYKKILKEQIDEEASYVDIAMFKKLLSDYEEMAKELWSVCNMNHELASLNKENRQQIKQYFDTPDQDNLLFNSYNCCIDDGDNVLFRYEQIELKKQKKQISTNEEGLQCNIAEKKCTEDKYIQADKTDDVKLMTNAEVQVNIEDKPKKVVQKPKKKFNWNFNHFQSNINKDKFCSFERIGDIFGYRNPSNLMISSRKSPFRNYDKNKDVGIGNNQGWKI